VQSQRIAIIKATKATVETVVFALGTWLLYETLLCPAQGLQTKLAQLLVATIASGALLHAWRRWTGRKDVHEQSVFPSRSEFFHVPMWLAWLGLSVLAWAIFGQDMIWDLERQLFILQAPSLNHEAVVDQTSGNVERGAANIVDGKFWIAVFAFIMAGVTGFYLAMLHRATDKAEKQVERLHSYEDKLSRRSCLSP